MYNFLVTARDGAWDEHGFVYDRARFLEYTSDEIASRFQKLETRHIAALKRYPCLFAYEGKSEPMRVGRLTRITPRGTGLYIEWQFDSDPIPFDKIEPLRNALDIRDWELNRTHWAIKDEPLIEVLSAHKLVPAKSNSAKKKADQLPTRVESKHRVSTVGEFISVVLDLDDGTKEVFYRGHSDEDYRLEPSLFRKDKDGNPVHLHSEDRMFRELLVSNSADFQSDISTLDRLVRMQHYSLPTRLFDITSNPLIALYFACMSHSEKNGEVISFAMTHDKIKYFDSDTASCIANLARLSKESKEQIEYPENNDVAGFNQQRAIYRLWHFIKEEKPYFDQRIDPKDLRSVICVKTKHSNSRIAFQSGAFLLFGHNATLSEDGSEDLTQTRISITNKEQVLKQLDRLNINNSTVFPYIERSATYIAKKFGFKKKDSGVS